MNFIKDNILWKIILILIGLGLALMLIGLIFGGARSLSIGSGGLRAPARQEAFSVSELDVGAITDIDIDVRYMDIKFKTAGRYGLEIIYYGNEPAPDWSAENGLLQVHQPQQSGFTVFDFNSEYPPSVVTVYVPADAQLTTVLLSTSSGNISLGQLKAGSARLLNSYGDIDIASLNSDSLQVELSSGDFTGLNIEAETIVYENSYGNGKWQSVSAGSLAASVSSGDLDFADCQLGGLQAQSSYGNIMADNLHAGGTELRTSSGDIDIAGDLRGETDISSSYGQIKISLAGKKSQYGYDISTSYGEVRLDGESMGEKARQANDDAATGHLDISCSSGDVKLAFGR